MGASCWAECGFAFGGGFVFGGRSAFGGAFAFEAGVGVPWSDSLYSESS